MAKQPIWKALQRLSDRFEAGVERNTGKRVAGAVVSTAETSMRQTRFGSTVTHLLRGDDVSFTRALTGAMKDATLGQLGLLGHNIAKAIDPYSAQLDEQAITLVEKLKRESGNDQDISNQDLLHGLEETAKNIDKRFDSVSRIVDLLEEDLPEFDERLKKVESQNQENIIAAADVLKGQVIKLITPISTRIDDAENQLRKLGNTVFEHESQIQRLQGRLGFLDHQMRQQLKLLSQVEQPSLEDMMPRTLKEREAFLGQLFGGKIPGSGKGGLFGTKFGLDDIDLFIHLKDYLGFGTGAAAGAAAGAAGTGGLGALLGILGKGALAGGALAGGVGLSAYMMYMNRERFKQLGESAGKRGGKYKFQDFRDFFGKKKDDPKSFPKQLRDQLLRKNKGKQTGFLDPTKDSKQQLQELFGKDKKAASMFGTLFTPPDPRQIPTAGRQLEAMMGMMQGDPKKFNQMMRMSNVPVGEAKEVKIRPDRVYTPGVGDPPFRWSDPEQFEALKKDIPGTNWYSGKGSKKIPEPDWLKHWKPKKPGVQPKKMQFDMESRTDPFLHKASFTPPMSSALRGVRGPAPRIPRNVPLGKMGRTTVFGDGTPDQLHRIYGGALTRGGGGQMAGLMRQFGGYGGGGGAYGTPGGGGSGWGTPPGATGGSGLAHQGDTYGYGKGEPGLIKMNKSGKVDPTSLRHYFIEKVKNSGLNGYVPADGAKYGIHKGTPEEWANFYSGLVQVESSHRAGTVGDVGKFAGNSNGLFQLSPNDAVNWGLNDGKPFSMAQLRDPKTNADAGMAIMEKLVKKTGSIRKGAGQYWGPIRRGEYKGAGTFRSKNLPWGRWARDDATGATAKDIREALAGGPGGPLGGRVEQAQMDEAKTRKGKLDPRLTTALEYAASRTGVFVRVTSGGQRMPGARGYTGTHEHDRGGAADFNLYVKDKNGKRRRLDPRKKADKPLIAAFTREAAKAGVRSAGAMYMGDPTKIHLGVSRKGVKAYRGPGWFKQAFYQGRGQKQAFDEAGGVAAYARTQEVAFKATPEQLAKMKKEGAKTLPWTASKRNIEEMQQSVKPLPYDTGTFDPRHVQKAQYKKDSFSGINPKLRKQMGKKYQGHGLGPDTRTPEQIREEWLRYKETGKFDVESDLSGSEAGRFAAPELKGAQRRQEQENIRKNLERPPGSLIDPRLPTLPGGVRYYDEKTGLQTDAIRKEDRPTTRGDAITKGKAIQRRYDKIMKEIDELNAMKPPKNASQAELLVHGLRVEEKMKKITEMQNAAPDSEKPRFRKANATGAWGAGPPGTNQLLYPHIPEKKTIPMESAQILAAGAPLIKSREVPMSRARGQGETEVVPATIRQKDVFERSKFLKETKPPEKIAAQAQAEKRLGVVPKFGASAIPKDLPVGEVKAVTKAPEIKTIQTTTAAKALEPTKAATPAAPPKTIPTEDPTKEAPIDGKRMPPGDVTYSAPDGGGGGGGDGSDSSRYSGGKELNDPQAFYPEDEPPSPGDTGYGTHYNCFI